MQNAGVGVGCFKAAGKSPPLAIESHAEANEVVDASRTLSTQDLDSLRPAQTSSGHEGIGHVLGNGVVVGDNRRNPALRVVRVALRQVGFGDQNDGVGAAGFNRSNQARDSASNDYDPWPLAGGFTGRGARRQG
jgi:hypothetical protein